MRIVTRTVLVSGFVAGALAAVMSCSDDAATIEPCDDIPPGGCPLSNGVACQDPSCTAVYACRANRVWQLDHLCPPHEAGAPPEASTSEGGEGGDAASDGPHEGSRPFDASIDAPPGAGGGPGCEDLQAPDCSLAVGLACPAGCCGCEDLFVCNNGGWDYYATCTQ